MHFRYFGFGIYYELGTEHLPRCSHSCEGTAMLGTKSGRSLKIADATLAVEMLSNGLQCNPPPPPSLSQGSD